MKTLAVFGTLMEAQLLVVRLEGSGVRTFVRNENMGNLLATPAIGGIKVDVAEEDYEKAKAIMDAAPESEKRA